MAQRTELRRDAWRVAVETEIQIACTKTEFVVAARLEAWEGGTARPRGPIPAPKSATQLLRTGWDVSCALARHRGVWHLVEIGNVYPL